MTVTGSPRALSLRAEVTRKALHLVAAAAPVAWGLGGVTSAAVRTALALALGVALLVELARRTSPRAHAAFDALFGTLVRPHETRALTGATWLVMAMLASVVIFPPAAAIIALWAVAVGDAAAALVGRLAALRRTPSTAKTHAGSLACALATGAGAWWLVGAPWAIAGVIGLVAALAERPRLGLDDNVRVAFAAGFAAWVLLVA
jgi:dolichol kinase